MLRLLPLLVLLLPLGAAETLADLEEPHGGADKLWEVTVLAEEAGKERALVYRNDVRSPFGLIVYDGAGREVYAKNGTRGVQTLPALDAGVYRFFVRGTGEFQVTEKALEKTIQERDLNATLVGTDAYLLAPREAFNVSIDGDVRIEWWDLTGRALDLEAPMRRLADPGGVFVMTIRGEEGAPYSLRLEPAEIPPARGAPTAAQTPALPIGAVLACLALVALRRRT